MLNIVMKKENYTLVRKRILATGQVQGVGFRPFVFKLATQNKLIGHVSNTSQGVCIEIQGNSQDIDEFITQLQKELPPLAIITSLKIDTLQIKTTEQDFKIVQSSDIGGHNVLISPDIGLCSQCLEDMHDINNIRYAYAFTNCTNCGPRYTITKSIPYDRSSTSMKCFKLCDTCQQEYTNPHNRRFHAQPNACPKCGPRIWAVQKQSRSSFKDASKNMRCQAAFKHVAQALLNGKVVAIKGLGGFHLSCSAFNIESISKIRKNKNRPHKPLAVMTSDIKTAKQVAHINDYEENLLNSSQKPIVLCKRKDILPNILAPDTDTIGLMLPYTPLHQVLFMHLNTINPDNSILALVMTSGNKANESICLQNREAINCLSDIAEIFLLHNRDILVRTDDSVCAVHHTEKNNYEQIFFRRARGYVPEPVYIKSWSKRNLAILGMGADLKNTICLTRKDTAFVSQYIGELENISTLAFQKEVIEHLEMLLQVKPQAIVYDAHPNFNSSQRAKEYATELNVPCFTLHHHYSHAYAVLAEHIDTLPIQPCLAIILDGTGYGEDGSIWGGEVLYIPHPTSNENHKRLGRLSPFPLIGGDLAIKEPWRIAVPLAKDSKFEDMLCSNIPESSIILEMINKNFTSTQTSSAGRLFDAISAGLGLCHSISYEGQAAIILENIQKNINYTYPHEPLCTPEKKDELWEISSQKLFTLTLEHAQKFNIKKAANFFHLELACALANMVKKISSEYKINHVILGGGVMQNASLYHMLYKNLYNMKFKILCPKKMPFNDGAISLGQVFYGNKILNLK